MGTDARAPRGAERFEKQPDIGVDEQEESN